MILTVNIGNTHITIAGYEHDTLQFSGRLHSSPAATVDEYAMNLLNLLSLYQVAPERIEGGILGSVVPALTGRVLGALRMFCSARFLTVGPGLKSGIKLRLDNPAQLAQNCCAVRWPHWKRDPDRWRSSRQILPSPLWQSTANRSWWAVSSCPGRSSPFPHWCKKLPSCPRSTLPPAPRSRCWAKAPRPVCKMALCWALPACWTVWRNVSAQSLARRQHSTPPAICPRPSGTPAARPSSTVRRSSRTACTASGCGIAAEVLFAFCKRLCYTILY